MDHLEELVEVLETSEDAEALEETTEGVIRLAFSWNCKSLFERMG